MFSPEVDFAVPDSALAPYVDAVNALLDSKGQPPLSVEDLVGGYAQLKALVDLCHLHGIAVIVDVVYNHAKGGEPLGHFDMADRDLYFTAEGVVDGLAYYYAKDGVRDYLIQHALTMLGEYHVDGLRCDEVSIIVDHQGQRFCRDLTRTRALRAPAREAYRRVLGRPGVGGPLGRRPVRSGGAGVRRRL
jgi:1,4-alpha-glucan branching enzyme